MPERLNRLEKDTDDWVRAGIISPEQKARILETRPGADREGRTMQLVGWIGGVLVGVGLTLWVANNWQYLHDAWRTLLLVTVSGLFVWAGWSFTARKYTVLGHVGYGLSGVAIGGTIFQIANWAHLPPNNPTLMLLWLGALVPMAYAFRSFPLALEAIIVLPIWMSWTAGNANLPGNAFLLIGCTALGVYGMAQWHDAARWPGFAIVYEAAGATAILVLALVATFLHGQHLEQARADGLLIATGSLALGAFAAGVVKAFMPRGQPTWDVAVRAVFLLLALVALFGTGQALVNILFPLLLVALILVAVQARNELIVNVGLMFFVAEILARYFDFLFDSLDPSAFFIIGGLMLLGLAFAVQKLRRTLTMAGAQDA